MNRNTAIIATVASALLCGCPGLFACFFGVISAAASQMPGADIDVFGTNDPTAALLMGLGAMCVGLVFISPPTAGGFFPRRGAPSPASERPPPPPPHPSQP